MSFVLGIDTSNYTTSCALLDTADMSVRSCKKLLPVKQGERGLRQSDAVFHHTKQLPELMKQLFDKRYDLSAVGYSYAPRCAEGSYMPCFLVGENVAQAVSLACGADLERLRIRWDIYLRHFIPAESLICSVLISLLRLFTSAVALQIFFCASPTRLS